MPRDFSQAKDLTGFQGTALLGTTPFGGPNLVVKDRYGLSSSSSEAGNGGMRVQIAMDPKISAKPVTTQAREDITASRLPHFRLRKAVGRESRLRVGMAPWRTVTVGQKTTFRIAS